MRNFIVQLLSIEGVIMGWAQSTHGREQNYDGPHGKWPIRTPNTDWLHAAGSY